MALEDQRDDRCHRGLSRTACMLFSLLLATAMLQPAGTQSAAAQKCIEYQPKSCWFALPADPNKDPIVFPRCAFVDCTFDVARELVCPFAAGGQFVETESAQCPDFMKVSKRRLPGCDEACCGGVVPGGFVKDGADAAAMHYRADEAAGCRYTDYRRHEIVGKLLDEGIDIVVAGDSMMRQFYLRLLQMLRGKRRIFDYRVHTHASYAHCDEGDAFRTASYMADMKQPEKKYLLDVIPEFFAKDTTQEPAGCTRNVGRINFLHAPLFATHGQVLEAYAKQADPNRKLVIISYVGVWTKVSNIPDKYFESLEQVLRRNGGAVVLALSVPTLKEVRAPERAAKYRVRNARLREWVQQNAGRAGFVDFESLSLSPDGPPTTKNDKHWSCYTTWPQEGRGGAAMSRLRRQMLAVNSFRERLYDNPVGHIWMTEDGECYDEMNRAVWNVALNAIMQASGNGTSFRLPAGAFAKLTLPIYQRDAMGDTPAEQAVRQEVDKLLDAQPKQSGGSSNGGSGGGGNSSGSGGSSKTASSATQKTRSGAGSGGRDSGGSSSSGSGGAGSLRAGTAAAQTAGSGSGSGGGTAQQASGSSAPRRKGSSASGAAAGGAGSRAGGSSGSAAGDRGASGAGIAEDGSVAAGSRKQQPGGRKAGAGGSAGHADRGSASSTGSDISAGTSSSGANTAAVTRSGNRSSGSGRSARGSQKAAAAGSRGASGNDLEDELEESLGAGSTRRNSDGASGDASASGAGSAARGSRANANSSPGRSRQGGGQAAGASGNDSSSSVNIPKDIDDGGEGADADDASGTGTTGRADSSGSAHSNSHGSNSLGASSADGSAGGQQGASASGRKGSKSSRKSSSGTSSASSSRSAGGEDELIGLINAGAGAGGSATAGNVSSDAEALGDMETGEQHSSSSGDVSGGIREAGALKEDETLDVDGETAPLLDEEA